MILSLRRTWEGTYAPVLGSLKSGLYRGQYKGRPRAFPFRSLRSLINAARWPEP